MKLNKDIKDEIPIELFNIDIYNNISFKILEYLNHSFSDCDALLNEKGRNKYHNLISIFYHHLTHLLCSYYFLKYDYKVLKLNHDYYLKYFNEKNINWPVSYSALSEDFYKTSSYSNSKKKLNKKNLLIRVNNLISLFSKNRLMILDNASGLNYIKMIKNSYNIESQPSNLNFEYVLGLEQWGILENNIKKLNDKLSDHLNSNISITHNFLKFLKEEFFKYHKPKAEFPIRSDFLITGTLAQLSARIIASNAKVKRKTVISIWHGESIGTMDEPVFKQVEFSYCDYLIGYGEFGCNELKNMNRLNLLFNNSLQIFQRDSQKIRKLFKGKQIDKIKKNQIVMYVPTSFSGSYRYGPYRDYNDLVYLHWQNSMLNQINDTFNPMQLIKKVHKKEKILQKINSSKIRIISDPYFYQILNQSDIFIFDYPTSAFTLAVATQKPIIYFNIGLRNLTENAKKSIKERCIYIEGSPKNAKIMVEEAYKRAKQDCINTYTEKYSLSENASQLESILNDIILGTKYD